jgi:hypothetical protein
MTKEQLLAVISRERHVRQINRISEDNGESIRATGRVSGKEALVQAFGRNRGG